MKLGIALWCCGWAEFGEGLVTILTLGYVITHWHLKVAEFFAFRDWI